MRTQPERGSHLPVLTTLINMTTGPVLEMGAGMFSTIYLHWACYESKRRLLTCEGDVRFFGFANQFKTDYHEIACTLNFDSIDLSEQWSVAFVDHAPADRRIVDIKRLVHADYVVAHDSERRSERSYRYSTITGLFKYRYDYINAYPNTIVLSNKYDLTNFKVG